MLIDSEQRQRHAFVDGFIESSRHDLLDNPHMDRYLGQTAIELEALCDRMFVPNLKYGKVSIPKKYRGEDGIPIVAVRPDDPDLQLGTEFSYFYPLQRDRYAAELNSLGFKSIDATLGYLQQLATEEFGESSRTFPNQCSGLRSATAFIVRPPFHFSLDPNAPGQTQANDKTAYLRPLMAIRYDNTRAFPAPVTVLAHEGTHILQVERDAIKSTVTGTAAKEEALELELEAYHNGASAVQANMDAHSLSANDMTQEELMTIVIEARRREHNSDQDPYRPNMAIVTALEKMGFPPLFHIADQNS